MLIKVVSPSEEERYMRGMVYEGKKISEFPFLKGGSFSVIDRNKEHFFDGSQVKIITYDDEEDYVDYEDDYIDDNFP